MSKETGGPIYHPDMSLRDFLAINATAEDVARHHVQRTIGGPKPSVEQARYLYADAMLAHRNREAGDE